MKAFTLRPLTIADYDTVHALWQRTEGMGLGASDTREAIAFFLDRNPGLSQVACNQSGEIIGAVLCGHDGRRGYLHHLAVNKTDREKGVGSALVDACLDRLVGLKIQKCNLFLIGSNTAGRTFWLHQGWQAREDIVLVQKELGAGPGGCGCTC